MNFDIVLNFEIDIKLEIRIIMLKFAPVGCVDGNCAGKKEDDKIE